MVAKNLFVGVNRPADSKNLTDLEKKHLPIIDTPESIKVGECFEATVEVGRLLAHPNEHGHYIEFIDVYADDTFLVRVDLSPGSTCPKATVCLSLEGPAQRLRVYERCNLHGIWIGEKPIAVTE